MTLEHLFRCDGPGCECWYSWLITEPPEPQHGFVFVHADFGEDLHFCSYTCLVRYALKTMPLTAAEVDGLGQLSDGGADAN